MKSGRWFLALSLLAVGLTPPGQGVVERIQGFYEGTRALKGQFSQRVELAMGQVEEARGAFYLKRPGMMRWEYEQPERRLLVTNGNTLWAYTPTDRQGLVQGLTTRGGPTPLFSCWGAGGG